MYRNKQLNNRMAPIRRAHAHSLMHTQSYTNQSLCPVELHWLLPPGSSSVGHEEPHTCNARCLSPWAWSAPHSSKIITQKKNITKKSRNECFQKYFLFVELLSPLIWPALPLCRSPELDTWPCTAWPTLYTCNRQHWSVLNNFLSGTASTG